MIPKGYRNGAIVETRHSSYFIDTNFVVNMDGVFCWNAIAVDLSDNTASWRASSYKDRNDAISKAVASFSEYPGFKIIEV